MKGGYYLLDAGGIDLSSSSPQSITGCWERAKSAMASGKPIVAQNLVYGEGNDLSPVNCFGWYISSTEIVLVSATLHIHVKSDNTATVLDVVT